MRTSINKNMALNNLETLSQLQHKDFSCLILEHQYLSFVRYRRILHFLLEVAYQTFLNIIS